MGSCDSNTGHFVYIARALSTELSSNSLPKFSALVLSINIFLKLTVPQLWKQILEVSGADKNWLITGYFLLQFKHPLVSH